MGFLGGDEQAFRAAVLRALAAVTESGPAEDHVAVFTHGLPINVVLSHALGLARIVHFRPDYGSITRLQTREAQAIAVVSVNEGGHHAWPDRLAS